MTNPDIFSEIKKIVRKRYAEGQPGLIKSDIESLLRRKSFKKTSKQEAYEIRRQVEKLEAESWASERVIKTGLDAIAKLGDSLAIQGGKVQDDILSALRKSAAANEGMKDMMKRLARLERLDRHVRETIAVTARTSLSRIQSVGRAVESGIKKFRYVGPPPERPKCVELYEREFTVEELQAMYNDFGQPVASHCGGWRCKHRLIAVVE